MTSAPHANGTVHSASDAAKAVLLAAENKAIPKRLRLAAEADPDWADLLTYVTGGPVGERPGRIKAHLVGVGRRKPDEAAGMQAALDLSVSGLKVAEPDGDEADEPKPTPVTLCLSDVTPTKIEFIWPGRVPRGKLTTFAGPGGLGKTLVTLDMAARKTTGTPWPDSPDVPNPVGSVILISTEDDLEDTIVPRLIDLKADLTKVRTLTTIERNKFTLADLDILERAVAEAGDVHLIVIDPVTAHVGAIDDHKNAPLRALLAPLAEFAGRHKIAIVLVTHTNKSTAGAAAARVIGSVAYLNAVRAAWLFVKDRDDKARRLLLPIKNNLGPEPTGLAYRIVGDPPRVQWEAEVIVDPDVDDAVAPEGRKAPEDGTKVAKAAEWLANLLAEYAIPSEEIFQSGKAAGFTKKNLYAAKELRGIEARNRGFGGVWHWGIGSPDAWMLRPQQPAEAQP